MSAIPQPQNTETPNFPFKTAFEEGIESLFLVKKELILSVINAIFAQFSKSVTNPKGDIHKALMLHSISFCLLYCQVRIASAILSKILISRQNTLRNPPLTSYRLINFGLISTSALTLTTVLGHKIALYIHPIFRSIISLPFSSTLNPAPDYFLISASTLCILNHIAPKISLFQRQ